MRFEFSLLLMVLASAALADPVGPPTIRVDQAWIRWLPAGVPAAGYATLTNVGDAPVTLIAVSSAYFKDASIHRSINQGGIMQMAPVKEITIDAHSRLEFSSTGYHLMLTEPTSSFESADEVPVTLRFADGSSLTTTFEVRRPGVGAAPPR